MCYEVPVQEGKSLVARQRTALVQTTVVTYLESLVHEVDDLANSTKIGVIELPKIRHDKQT